ncbi:TIGR04222 domain-containing membrane protein [Actinomadura algeriensis]|uniref:Uncharacterized protein (TIGR04222 family) n=1 Tax=Actinomadura algeriensis TaxID=1679523 RepID=A0ABR9JXQ2_9ACTN|nr:TIGR04222 domain-containing membrane protein [Actinomadura algeriensis]MBE1535169.1 uncharacterized protein (TIGR04222 family) [Actinomadura algeriensis]
MGDARSAVAWAAAAQWDGPWPSVVVWAVLVPVSAALLARALMVRRRLGRGVPPARDPHPYEAALFRSGENRAILTGLAVLRAEGAIGAEPPGRLVVAGKRRGPGRPLDDALHAAIGRGREPSELSRDPKVRAALEGLRAELERAGQLLGPAERDGRRAAALPLLAVAGIGALFVLIFPGDAPLTALVAAFLIEAALAVSALVLVLGPWSRTAEGKRAMAAYEERHGHLAPWNDPAWTTYGAAAVAAGVALFGLPALSGAEPDFTEAADLRKDFGGGAGAQGAGGGGCGGGDGGGCGGCGGCGG